MKPSGLKNVVAIVALLAAAALFHWAQRNLETAPSGSTGSRQGDSSDNAAGDFDFYVLALSWSPTWCAEQGNDFDGVLQCSTARPYAFVVHGLWPQNERGWPEFCDSPFGARIDRSIADRLLDIMPSRDLVFHQWRKHGSCSGLSPDDFFALVRKAHDIVVVPEAYRAMDQFENVSPRDVERVFIAANPGLQSNAIAVTCSSRYLREVRICLDTSLTFRACPEVDAKACNSAKTIMPPVRGG
jgi:ribonuclease T2